MLKINSIDEMRADIARRTKRGISFILASVFIWAAISVVWLLPIPNILAKNLLTFCFAAPLLPIAYVLSRIIKAEFSARENPLNKLGILFSMNQLLYLLIAIWAFAGAPDKMVVIIAIVFGAHLLPFSWLYRSKAYLVIAVIVPILITIIGWNLAEDSLFIVPLVMLLVEIIFSLWLFAENRRLD
jgi:hypothetical protein